MTVHPAGTSAKSGHKEYWPSPLASTRKIPSGLSNGFDMTMPSFEKSFVFASKLLVSLRYVFFDLVFELIDFVLIQ
jgi:hypothetical protein